MKHITVSAAVILRDNNGRKEVFATARGYGDWKGWWEFPGGKIEEGESPEECIVREIGEELDSVVSPVKVLDVVEYQYPEFLLTMHCILCSLVEGELKLLEHQDARWLTKENLRDVKWLPADEMILDKIEDLL